MTLDGVLRVSVTSGRSGAATGRRSRGDADPFVCRIGGHPKAGRAPVHRCHSFSTPPRCGAPSLSRLGGAGRLPQPGEPRYILGDQVPDTALLKAVYVTLVGSAH